MLSRVLFAGDPAVVVPLIALLWFVTGAVAGWCIGRNPGPESKQAVRAPRSRKAVRGAEVYVGNLPYNADEKDIDRLFAEYGQVTSTRIIRHRLSGKSRGYGFVTMADGSEKDAAIRKLNGREFKGRRLVVNEAKSRGR